MNWQAVSLWQLYVGDAEGNIIPLRQTAPDVWRAIWSGKRYLPKGR